MFVHTGLDFTTPIFVQSYTNIIFGPNGKFITDEVGAPPFIFENVHDITWINTQILYVGNFALSGGLNYNIAPSAERRQSAQ